MKDFVEIKRIFDAPIEEVFDAWVEQDKLSKWHCPEGMWAEASVTEKKSYKIVMHDEKDKENTHTVFGDYLVFERPSRLIFSWQWTWDKKSEKVTQVEVLFKKLNKNKTQVILKHTGFTDNAMREEHSFGWTSTLINLEKYLRGGENYI